LPLTYFLQLTSIREMDNVELHSAAQFFTMFRKFDHITPVLRDLHYITPVLRDLHYITPVLRDLHYITPVLRDLHWLPVRRSITFKVATLVYKCLQGFVPPYLAEDCVLVASLSGRQHLRFADICKLLVPKTSTNYESRGLSLFMDPTQGTAFQLNCN